MKKNKRSKLIWLGFLVLVFFLILVGLFIFNRNKERPSDFKIGVLADDGLALVSFSKERKMINVLKINSETEVWIPGGLGWYRGGVVKKILQQEGKNNLLGKILFYDFGFDADRVVILKKIDDWKSKFWLRYSINSNRLLVKEEILNKDLDNSDDFLDETMVRDFSETKLVNDDLKLSVFNLTQESGLAIFMTKRLERLGFSVISLGNSDNGLDKCQIIYGAKVKDTFAWKVLDKLIDCPKTESDSLNEGEVELYFDKNFSTMIKYPSYNR